MRNGENNRRQTAVPFHPRTPAGISLAWAVLVFCAAGTAKASSLSLDEYLRQVQKSDPGYHSLVQESAGAEMTARQADLLFRPQFFTNLSYIDDTRDTAAPEIQGVKNIQRSASVGVREKTPYGMGVQLSFDINHTYLFDTDPTLVTRPSLTNAYVVPAVSMSLWQNFLGAADRSQQRTMQARELATSYGRAFQARASLVQAEAAYWKLAITRELTRVQKSSVERAKAILEYDSKKMEKKLIDESDLLLARAAVKGKELELVGLEDEERSAAHAFNSARGTDSDEVPEELPLPEPRAIQAIQSHERHGAREDVRAAEQEMIAKEAGGRMAREKLLPDLSVYGSIFSWGVNFSMPLDFGTTNAVRDGYAEEIAAADLSYQRKVMDADRDWKELARKFEDAKKRMDLALDLEEIQKKKFENVRARRSRGLTVEDQVFQYELDYLNASVNRVQIEGAILAIAAQMKLFAASNETGETGARP